jgi:flavorubredoxin
MANALVVFTTRTSQTKKIAELVAEGMRMGGLDVNVMNMTDVDQQGVDLGSFDALVLGSPTYHGEMVQAMKTFLFKAEKVNLEGKVGGAFGAFGWSGEAPGRIFDTMKNIFKMDMVGGPLMLKSAGLGGGVQMAQSYGRDIAAKCCGSK